MYGNYTTYEQIEATERFFVGGHFLVTFSGRPNVYLAQKKILRGAMGPWPSHSAATAYEI